jgi:protein TonB
MMTIERPTAAEEVDAMESGGSAHPLFESRVGEPEGRRAWAWPLTLSLHALAALAIIVVPLLSSEPLPPEATSQVRAFFVAPQVAPPPPPPPPPAAARAAVAPRVTPPPAASGFTAPVDIPDTIVADSPLDTGLEGGVPGGVEGGVPGGVVGGVVGGIDAAPAPPPQVVRVGGVIREPKKVKDVAPVYPKIAMTARVQGVVILECVVSPQGRVENVKVLRSIPSLDDAAVDAVKQWVYTPTLLGGVPVGVVMTVTVNFVLRNAVLS